MGDAIMAGFRLIAREPRAFLAWTLVYAVTGLGPQALSMVLNVNTFAAASSGQQPDPAALSQAMGSLQALQPFSLLAVLLNSILLYGAVFRAVLFPEERRFAYLRLGGRELWLVLTMIALVAIFTVALIALILPIVLILGIGVAAAGAQAPEGLARWAWSASCCWSRLWASLSGACCGCRWPCRWPSRPGDSRSPKPGGRPRAMRCGCWACSP